MVHPDTSARSGEGAGTGGWGWAVPRLFALAALLLVLFMTAPHGPGLSPDSAIYLSAAENLAAGHGLRDFTGEPLVRWAPGYPAVLAGAAALGLDLGPAARCLNAVLFAALVLLAARWLPRQVRDPRLAAVALAAVAVSPALTRVSVYVWSEPLFLVLTLLCLLDLESFARRGGRGRLARAALWAAAATLTRYAGVSLLAPGLWVALSRRRETSARRLGDAALFAVLALAPLAAWLVRNRFVAGSFFGERAASSYPPAASLWLALEQMSRWLLPHPVAAAPLRVAVLLAVVGLAAWALARRGPEGDGAGERGPLAPAAVWAAAYLVVLVAWTSTAAVEQINERYLAPLYLPFVALCAGALAALAQGPRRRFPRGAALALMLLWLAYPAAHTAWRWLAYADGGIDGYGTPAWRQSELARLVRAHPEAQPLFSNAPDAAYCLAGVPAKLSPRRTFYNSPQPAVRDLERARAAVAGAPGRRAYLAWFAGVERPFLHSVADLESVFAVRSQAVCADGELYSLEAR